MKKKIYPQWVTPIPDLGDSEEKILNLGLMVEWVKTLGDVMIAFGMGEEQGFGRVGTEG